MYYSTVFAYDSNAVAHIQLYTAMIQACTVCIVLLVLSHSGLAEQVPISVDPQTYDSSHTKAHLLLQAHFSRVPLPIADYNTDIKSVLDQSLRILQVKNLN